VTRPPDDGRKRDDGYQGLNEGETTVHGEDGPGGRTVAVASTREWAS
jgi:hypothetical protein